MPRVKRGKSHLKRRKNILAKTKGYKWGRRNLIKAAKTAVTKAGVRSYVDRRKKKRTSRALWQIKINAFLREKGESYSRFISVLKKNKVGLDKKILADLAANNREILTEIIKKIKETGKIID